MQTGKPPGEAGPTRPDWARERAKGWIPGQKLLRSIRSWQASRTFVGRRLAVIRHRFWSAVSGADIPVTTIIGGGLMLPHPCGIVIHPKVSIGVNCLIFQNVTLGMRRSKVPAIGDNVLIGAGAIILGDVSVGDDAVIGAGAVVITDVPPGCTAIGNPARLLAP